MRQGRPGAWVVMLVAAIPLVGCAPSWEWIEAAPEPYSVAAFALELPAGWVRLAGPGERVVLSRDGPGIQWIEVERVAYAKAFPVLEEAATVHMLPSELAEMTTAELRAGAGMAGLEVLSTAPAELDGHMGFRLHLVIKPPDGPVYERVVYGCAAPGGVYFLTFQAPRLHYFERDLPVFEQLVRSLRVPAAS